MKYVSALLLVFSIYSHAEPTTVPTVDLSQYVGHWFEIASYPQWFEKDCVGSTADYTLRADGDVDVENKCFKNNFEGKLSSVKGIAKVVDRQSHAKLKVSFFRPFWGQYWIVDLGPQYQYAVVSNEKMSSLWILSRQSKIAPALYAEITSRLRGKGFDLGKLKMTLQK